MKRFIYTFVLSAMMLLPGCTTDTTQPDPIDMELENNMFPSWDEASDDGTNWSSARLAGQAYIVVFSAQWCNDPCYSLFHNYWSWESDLPMMVFSTDNGSDISFDDWHASADAHDDEGDDTRVNLTSYVFLLGDEEAIELGVTGPGTTFFVNADGEIIWSGKSRHADNEDTFREQWANAQGL